MASAQARAEVYIGDQIDQSEFESSLDLAAAFSDPLKPMQRTAVMIPVAAHQDSGYIFHTASEYAKQTRTEPFTVFMLLNAPERYEASMRAAVTEVKRAQATFPGLDLRFGTELNLDDQMPIGSIRRELWNSVFILANAQGLFKTDNGEVIGINNDIDTTFISPHYISRIQQYYQTRQAHARQLGITQPRLAPVGTHLSHAILPSHPNVGKVTSWVDISYFQSISHANYEAGLVIPFSHYAHVGGFDPNAKTYETRRFTESYNLKHLTGAQMHTHPRRYIDRLHDNGTGGIWTDDSFGDSDQCRQTLAPDISTDRSETVILEYLERDIRLFWLGGAVFRLCKHLQTSQQFIENHGYSVDSIRPSVSSAIDKQLTRAERFLDTFVGSPVLKSLVRDCVDLNQEVDEALEIISARTSLIKG